MKDYYDYDWLSGVHVEVEKSGVAIEVERQKALEDAERMKILSGFEDEIDDTDRMKYKMSLDDLSDPPTFMEELQNI